MIDRKSEAIIEFNKFDNELTFTIIPKKLEENEIIKNEDRGDTDLELRFIQKIEISYSPEKSITAKLNNYYTGNLESKCSMYGLYIEKVKTLLESDESINFLVMSSSEEIFSNKNTKFKVTPAGIKDPNFKIEEIAVERIFHPEEDEKEADNILLRCKVIYEELNNTIIIEIKDNRRYLNKFELGYDDKKKTLNIIDGFFDSGITCTIKEQKPDVEIKRLIVYINNEIFKTRNGQLMYTHQLEKDVDFLENVNLCDVKFNKNADITLGFINETRKLVLV